MTTRVRLQLAGGIARIVMDDGKVNAMSGGMLGEIDAALTRAEEAGAVTILSGREHIFSAGFDFATFKRGPDATREMVHAGFRLIERLLGFPFPVLTVCTGHAYPMGAFLMLAADMRIGIDGPWRIGLNEVAIGLTVPGFAVELARQRLTPPGFARIATAAMFEPQEAVRLGYLDRVVDAADLAGVVEEEVARLRTLDMQHFAATKARLNAPVIRAVREAADAEL